MKLSLADEKNALRKRALAARDALSMEGRIESSVALVSIAAANIEIEPGQIVAGYHPIRSELDPRPLMAELATLGARLCLPVVMGETSMEFRDLVRGAPMVASGFGTIGPDDDAQVVDPDHILLPLSAFDRQGNRLGYGAGFYDRAIAALEGRGMKTRLWGLSFAVQEADNVPRGEHDRVLHGIATETEWIPVSP
ncbi:5-formyltetrahydrofolate cyclo-ligase [Ahrensia sp. R2A130]|uniref:5-formyltetrahydrofolate cyclo-ligase n=1 Tax=Ahrensia sp. R2A130 TaxID=744979 RepID=UPI001FFF8CC7|nr:5-formyltetrahydrofolate cyclo-ligase [Ahrensia sp. R2A130]